MNIKIPILKILAYILLAPFLITTGALCFFSRRAADSRNARIVWGPDPIINNKYWSMAMKNAGYQSRTYMYSFYQKINKKEDYDEYINERLCWVPLPVRLVFLFWESLFRFDVFVIPFHGWLLGRTPYWFLEAPILHFARKKIMVMPYGGDAYVYGKVRSMGLLHGLMLSYPQAARQQGRIEKRVQYWVRHADWVLTCRLGMDGFGRWDILIPTNLYIDIGQWAQSPRKSSADGVNGTVYIAHAPNHVGFKGTEFIEHAIEQLREEGLKVEFVLLQDMQNDQIRKIFLEDVDILVEQLVGPGFGMNGLEGMASGLPVICNLEEKEYTEIFRRWSYFKECPVVSASPENITDVLRKLVQRPALRHQLGDLSRRYCEKYHGLDSCHHLHSNALKFIYGDIDSRTMMNLYHPLYSDHNKHLPRIEPPLVDNRIVD